MGDLKGRVLTTAVMLVAWRRREPRGKYYDNPEEYPTTLKEIRNCLSLEAIPVFDSIYTKPKIIDDLKLYLENLKFIVLGLVLGGGTNAPMHGAPALLLSHAYSPLMYIPRYRSVRGLSG